MPTCFYNRAKGELEPEIILGGRMMRLAYASPCRKFLSWPLFGTAICSRLLGWYANRSFSKGRIDSTIRELKIDMADFEVPDGGFKCFNDFFARRLKPGARPFATDGLCSPADCRLTVYPELHEDSCIPVKGAEFSVTELLFGLNPPPKTGTSEDDRWDLAKEFKGGSLCVFRLCPSDYHRFHFPDDGKVIDSWRIPGRYDSVHPIALEQRIKVFTSNVRQVSMLELAKFGLAAYVEVGAFGVASIHSTFDGKEFSRGDEKGYFDFGGSTVIMVFGKGAVKYDKDLLEQSANGVECLIRAGEHIGNFCR
ncbi:MAG: phosphatidylserine decarboxylase [Victivallales bacterium]|nr:phosphatidylserine decarboxylase [Victivallales bacterium]